MNVNLILSCQNGIEISFKRLMKGFQKARPLQVLVLSTKAERTENKQTSRKKCVWGERVWEKGAQGISLVMFVYGCFKLRN